MEHANLETLVIPDAYVEVDHASRPPLHEEQMQDVENLFAPESIPILGSNSAHISRLATAEEGPWSSQRVSSSTIVIEGDCASVDPEIKAAWAGAPNQLQVFFNEGAGGMGVDDGNSEIDGTFSAEAIDFEEGETRFRGDVGEFASEAYMEFEPSSPPTSSSPPQIFSSPQMSQSSEASDTMSTDDVDELCDDVEEHEVTASLDENDVFVRVDSAEFDDGNIVGQENQETEVSQGRIELGLIEEQDEIVTQSHEVPEYLHVQLVDSISVERQIEEAQGECDNAEATPLEQPGDERCNNMEERDILPQTSDELDDGKFQVDEEQHAFPALFEVRFAETPLSPMPMEPIERDLDDARELPHQEHVDPGDADQDISTYTHFSEMVTIPQPGNDGAQDPLVPASTALELGVDGQEKAAEEDDDQRRTQSIAEAHKIKTADQIEIQDAKIREDLPNPRRPTAASQRRQFRKLTKPFRTPFVQPKSAAKKEPIVDEQPVVTEDTTKQSEKPPTPKTENMIRHRTVKAAAQFKSPLAACASTQVIPSVRMTPQIQFLERKIQVLKRAVKIQSDGDEQNLENLAKKWKEAAQEAAWSVWELVKDRAQDDGSKGWGSEQDSRKRSFSDSWGWEEQDEAKARKLSGGEETEDESDGKERRASLDEDDDEGNQDTIGTMLRQFGIAPETLGWDDNEGTFC